MMVHVVRSIVDPQPINADGPATPPAEQTETHAILGELHGAFGELRCVASERFAKQGVSMTHLHVASMLDHHGTLTMSHLADLLGVSMSNATGLIDRMEERRFVERMRDQDDRRVVFVRLAAGGTEMLNNAQVVKQELILKILGRLDEGQLRCVRQALTSLRAAAVDIAADPDVAAQWHAHTH
jgi:DNA-binding MarR family transcriptional regulator